MSSDTTRHRASSATTPCTGTRKTNKGSEDGRVRTHGSVLRDKHELSRRAGAKLPQDLETLWGHAIRRRRARAHLCLVGESALGAIGSDLLIEVVGTGGRLAAVVLGAIELLAHARRGRGTPGSDGRQRGPLVHARRLVRHAHLRTRGSERQGSRDTSQYRRMAIQAGNHTGRKPVCDLIAVWLIPTPLMRLPGCSVPVCLRGR